MATVNAPAFDPQSPDAEILDAFEKVRAGRAWSYGRANAGADLSIDESSHYDAEQVALERIVYHTRAKTIPGVAARLTLLLPALECDLWLDVAFADHGIFAMLDGRDLLDGNLQVLIEAAHDLIQIEWDRALAEYQRAYAHHDAAGAVASAIEIEVIRVQREGLEPSAELKEALQLAEDIRDERCSEDCEAFKRLMQAQAPDFAAYQKKAELAIAENAQDVAAPWLLRDAKMLMGRAASVKADRIQQLASGKPEARAA